MKIIVNHSSLVPIYEQVAGQIKKNIADGILKENDMLPSVRKLAADLKISALTVKKAYDSLEQTGIIVTVHGKGSFVSGNTSQIVMEESVRILENEMRKLAEKCRTQGMSDDDIRQMLELVLEVER